MTQYTYLLIDLLSLLVPLIFSFHPNIRLYRYWKGLLLAIIATGFFYCIWDSWFTKQGLWGFNPTYITGIHFGNLPLEEVLFFICIPYSCVFTFECLSKTISSSFLDKYITYINYSFATVLIALSIHFHEKLYTQFAFAILAVLILIINWKKLPWMPKFYVVYAILLVPFTIVNGLLTGTGLSEPIVWYKAVGIIGLRVLTIPIEDIFYGMGLILINVWIYTHLKSQEGLQT